MTLTRLWFSWTAAVLLLSASPSAQDEELPCQERFRPGKEDFALNTDESVKEGASFLSFPKVSRAEDCLQACCNDPNCNLALMEHGEDSKVISCFIINCLYKQKEVCHFVRKKGFSNYLRKSVFDEKQISVFLERQVTDAEDKPPRASAGQDRVFQPGEDVVLNGIESKDDKQIVQYDWTQVSGDTTAVITKGMFPDSVTVSGLSPGMYKFRLTVTDDAGQTGSSDVSVLVLTPEQSRHHCLVPKKEGPCRGSFPRWHYNAASERCEEFKFGGCKQNLNNYLSLNECLNACDKVSVSTPHPSSGRLGPIDFAEQCEVPCGPENFKCDNECCIRKELECDGETQCSDGSDEAQCENVKKKFGRLLEIPLDKSKALCVEPPKTGTGHRSFTKWYYNPYEQRCNRFNWGGDDGNQNRFDTEESCMAACSSVTKDDVFANKALFEKQETDTDTAAIAIAIILAFAIAILLVVLTYCLLKNKKKNRNKHHQVASNGAHVHTFEDSEKLVYNSTTKPI